MEERVARRVSGMAVFQQAVRDAFAFLETEYGFRVAAADEACVRFESERARVAVRRGPGRHQLRLEIARRDAAREPPVGLPELLALADGRRGFATAREMLARNVLEVAAVVRTLGGALLRGDPGAFRRAYARRRPSLPR
ncbi:MAG TPA: hypothetical protein VFD84_12540 [Candidatus Binatia bacterium]|jgi:hypothetical protein|nr:hypothetical protein [Candidatus Binatia bacterium]